ncbi:MAG: hypothetical protein AB1726_13010 [Planctomycetota bacterium]
MTVLPADAGARGARTSPLRRIRKILGRIRRRFVLDTYDVFARRIPAVPEDLGAPDGYEFSWGSAADVAGCDEHHTELDEKERREGIVRLRLGHRVVVAKRDGEVVFSMWENPRNLNVPGLIKRRLGAHQSFIYKAFTSPDHRGRRLYEAGMRFVLGALAAEGKRELVGYAHVKKRISRQGLAALRFDSVGRVRLLAGPGWRRAFVSRRLAERFPEPLPRSEAVAKAMADPKGP